ncbi:hypothetical protein GCM10009609_19820 [Pseudonocardia aurantiaca]|uniref:Uncharacterized protein n=1 Tax=Pseudonocardia aurantiaca TaxID=75290 RepID=A0ABW4FPV9_9PSEU
MPGPVLRDAVLRDPGLPDLSGNVAVVTGAGGGIGSGIALRFAAAGAAVVCVFLASPMARFVSGHDLVVDGGMAAVPSW